MCIVGVYIQCRHSAGASASWESERQGGGRKVEKMCCQAIYAQSGVAGGITHRPTIAVLRGPAISSLATVYIIALFRLGMVG